MQTVYPYDKGARSSGGRIGPPPLPFPGVQLHMSPWRDSMLRIDTEDKIDGLGVYVSSWAGRLVIIVDRYARLHEGVE